ncbi:hypothetical protein Taro_046533 [Colocasia esculenta]|uniref:Uncharacterized protein n=1 Tax=Colocasia esculenta TaxID=4460 RepID=A0A843WQ68_COLES|nr:hypothetical protein [Colocasia esculenta]
MVIPGRRGGLDGGADWLLAGNQLVLGRLVQRLMHGASHWSQVSSLPVSTSRKYGFGGSPMLSNA